MINKHMKITTITMYIASPENKIVYTCTVRKVGIVV